MLSRLFLRRNFSSLGRALAENGTPAKISADEFRGRRAKLLDTIRESMTESDASSANAMAPIVFAASQRQTFSAPDVPHVFRQCANFRYLTGFDGVDAAQLLVDERRSVLFVDERTENETLWNGRALSEEEILRISGVDKVLPLSEFETYLAASVRGDSILSADLSRIKREAHLDENMKNSYRILRGIPARMELLPHMDKIRWQKSAAESALMRETCRVGGGALNATVANAAAFTNEAQLVGLLEFEARRRGAQFLAYPPVVAAGANANTIHYISARENINPTDCVLIDAGSDVGGYASDITRCFPISRRFSAPQRTLYDALACVHDELLWYVGEVRPLRLNELYVHMLKTMTNVLGEMDFFARELSRDEMFMECDKLCPHHVSHYLGMDVHDSPTVSRSIPVLPGVVITVEPGIYVRSDNEMVREEFRGIGFRIEDDILITETGSELLTGDCVRHPDDIEALMG